MKTLVDLKLGEEGVISAFQHDTDLKNKLIGMGCFPGETIRINKRAPLGCPIAVDVAGYQLSLRQEEADCIILQSE